MTDIFSTFPASRWLLVLSACFFIGWGFGEVDAKMYRSVKTLLAETYLNKFNAMSGANIDEYIYYVISDDEQTLRRVASESIGVNRIEASDIPTVFHAYIAAAERQKMLLRLRGMPTVTAVRFPHLTICQRSKSERQKPALLQTRLDGAR